MALVSPITAALVAPYTNRFGAPFTEDAAEDMLMMEPPRPADSMAGNNALVMRYIERTFRSKEKSQSFSSVSRIVP